MYSRVSPVFHKSNEWAKFLNDFATRHEYCVYFGNEEEFENLLRRLYDGNNWEKIEMEVLRNSLGLNPPLDQEVHFPRFESADSLGRN